MNRQQKRVIILIACAIGLAAGALTYLTSHSGAQALIAAPAAITSFWGLLRDFLTRDVERPADDHSNSSPLPEGGPPRGGGKCVKEGQAAVQQFDLDAADVARQSRSERDI
jgi:hypothetical protein